MLILSHGQATCEKSFSINRLIVVDNTKETSFIAQRSIHDHILHIRGIDALVVSKALLVSAASGRKHYFEYPGGAEKVESTGNFLFLMKSNASLRSAKEMEARIGELAKTVKDLEQKSKDV